MTYRGGPRDGATERHPNPPLFQYEDGTTLHYKRLSGVHVSFRDRVGRAIHGPDGYYRREGDVYVHVARRMPRPGGAV